MGGKATDIIDTQYFVLFISTVHQRFPVVPRAYDSSGSKKEREDQEEKAQILCNHGSIVIEAQPTREG